MRCSILPNLEEADNTAGDSHAEPEQQGDGGG